MNPRGTDSTSARNEGDRPNRPFCVVCGDVTACFHKPDAVIVAAWEQETYHNAKKKREEK